MNIRTNRNFSHALGRAYTLPFAVSLLLVLPLALPTTLQAAPAAVPATAASAQTTSAEPKAAGTISANISGKPTSAAASNKQETASTAATAATDAAKQATPPAVTIEEAKYEAVDKYAKVDISWHQLLCRIDADGLYTQQTEEWFACIPNNYSQKPMGSKITTLFKSKYMTTEAELKSRPPYYQGFVVQANIDRCATFLGKHKKTFAAAEKKFGVPKEVVVSLLMVETRLGEYTGSASPLWSLACMAAADNPSRVNNYLAELPLETAHLDWLQSTLKARSDWAYKELVALIRHSSKNALDPVQMSGSIFGAVGLCQFMPTNIPLYGADGNADGRVDLFNIDDAIFSASNYLKQHGWKGKITHNQQVGVLRRYNNSTQYANTILSLADGVRAKAKLDAAKQKNKKATKAKPATKPAAKQPAAKATTKVTAKPAAKSSANAKQQTTTKNTAKPVTKPAAKPASTNASAKPTADNASIKPAKPNTTTTAKPTASTAN